MFDETHRVTNQPPPFRDVNLFEVDPTLQEAVAAYDGGWGRDALSAYGALAGGELRRHGELANRFAPELVSYDPYGHRIDRVEFHPSYHALMSAAVAHGVHSLPWETDRTGAQAVRAALELLHNQADSGTDCPITMTFASVPALRAEPDLAAIWVPRILSRRYDASTQPAAHKSGLTIGMAMTEKQGGTDVRANSSRAQPANESRGPGEAFRLTGHKWFCSAPMSDAFLTLAYLDGGLTCFLMPRVLPDGERNAIRIERLKDKLGNRSNASAEIEFDGALAWRLGPPGRGVATILTMVVMTRFNCIVGSTALMRHAAMQVLHHIAHRSVGGAKLIDAPLMRNVAADLVLESEAALWLSMRIARSIERRDDEREALFARLATALGKYWICKRTPQHVNEAQECLGGLGYIEDHVMARLYREAPVNSIWEGSGNVQCVDLLRALARSPETVDAYFAEIDLARGEHRALDRARDALGAELRTGPSDPFAARRLAEQMALTLEASLLARHASGAIASEFVASRLEPTRLAYGTLTDARAVDALLSRFALP